MAINLDDNPKLDNPSLIITDSSIGFDVFWWLVAYQIVGIIYYDLPDGGAAGVRQVRVGMIDRKSTETCKRL